MLQVYNAVLDERQRRKDFVLERDLHIPKEKKKNKEEKQIYNDFRPFVRFFEHQEEYDKMIQVSSLCCYSLCRYASMLVFHGTSIG